MQDVQPIMCLYVLIADLKFVVLGDCDDSQAAAIAWLWTDGKMDLEVHKKYKGVYIVKVKERIVLREIHLRTTGRHLCLCIEWMFVAVRWHWVCAIWEISRFIWCQCVTIMCVCKLH